MAWSNQETSQVLKALAVACEITGTSLSEPTRQFVVMDLQKYEADRVVDALGRCLHSTKSKLTLAHIIEELHRVDRKQLSDSHAKREAYLTALRGAALVERIPWEDGPESVRQQLNSRGYKFPAVPEKQKRLPELKEAHSAPHWTDDKEADG